MPDKSGEMTLVDHGRLNNSFKLHYQTARLGQAPLTDEDWFRFAFVRNPWSRLVSAFVNKFPTLHDLACVVIQKIHRRWKNNPFQIVAREVWRSPSLLSIQRGVRLTLWPLVLGKKAWWDAMTFRHFVEFLATEDLDAGEADLHWRPQYRFLSNVSFQFLGRFERLEEDLKTISSLLGIEATLPTFNSTNYAKPDEVPVGCFADAPLSHLRTLVAMPDYRRFYTRELKQQVASLYHRDIAEFGYEFDS